MQQSVLVIGIAGEEILSAGALVDEFQNHFVADTLKIAITPGFERIRAGGATAFFLGTIVRAAGGMRFNLVGLTPDDVDTAAVRLPAGNAGCEVFIGVSDAAI